MSVSEPRFSEEHGHLVMRLQHDGHEHGLRAPLDKFNREDAERQLMMSYRYTRRMIEEGKFDRAGCNSDDAVQEESK